MRIRDTVENVRVNDIYHEVMSSCSSDAHCAGFASESWSCRADSVNEDSVVFFSLHGVNCAYCNTVLVFAVEKFEFIFVA